MTETKTAVGTRSVTVITTVGERKVIETAATTWKELEREVKQTHSLSNMKVVEGVRRTTLEHPDAVLPDGNFKLYLLPVKSKSGAKAAAPKKKAVAKKAVAKKAAPVKKATTKKAATKAPAKAKVIKAVKVAEPVVEQSPEELKSEIKSLASGFADVKTIY
jgi:hypothetical protein